MKHKHYDAIIAYANGEQIQIFNRPEDKWVDSTTPTFSPDSQYRVKPKEVKLVPHWQAIIDHPLRFSHRLFKTKEEAVRVYRHTIRLATEYPVILLPEEEPILEHRGPGWPGR